MEDKVGNDFADMAADFERRRVSDLVMDVRRRFVSACASWSPVVLDLHRFFVATSRAAVNEDGCAGVALHPTVWSEGGLAKRRGVCVSAWEFAWVPGSPGLWRSGSTSWRSTVDDMGVGGVSFVEFLDLYERWAGERPVLELFIPEQSRSGRPISVSAVPSGPSID